MDVQCGGGGLFYFYLIFFRKAALPLCLGSRVTMCGRRLTEGSDTLTSCMFIFMVTSPDCHSHA